MGRWGSEDGGWRERRRGEALGVAGRELLGEGEVVV